MMFRKACELKNVVLSQSPFGNVFSLVHVLYFCKQYDIISKSYKTVDNSRMEQGITKLQTTFFIIQKCYPFASIKI